MEITCQGAHSLAALSRKAFHKSFVLTFSESALRCTCVRVCACVWGGAGRNQFSFSTWIPGYYTQEQVPLPLDHLSAALPPTSGLSPDWT